MNYRWTFVLSLIALTLFACLYHLNHQNDKKIDNAFIKKENVPSYIGEGMHAIVFNPQGNIKYIANAKKLTHFEQSNETLFQFPQVFLFDKNKNQPDAQNWEMTAKQAILNGNNDILELKNDVEIHSLLATSPLQQLLTSEAKINLKTQDVSSDKKVTLIGLNFTTTGLELTGNLKSQLATLKKQVNTHYDKHEE